MDNKLSQESVEYIEIPFDDLFKINSDIDLFVRLEREYPDFVINYVEPDNVIGSDPFMMIFKCWGYKKTAATITPPSIDLIKTLQRLVKHENSKE